MRRPPDSRVVPPGSSPDGVIGELRVDHNHYYITIQQTDSGMRGGAGATQRPARPGTEVGRFELDGQTCLVFRIDHGGADGDPVDMLTRRELQIATLVAQGRPNKQIADQLKISEWTVSTHLRRIFGKLRVDSRAAMVYRCAALLRKMPQP